jgi:hypothetical protein
MPWPGGKGFCKSGICANSNTAAAKYLAPAARALRYTPVMKLLGSMTLAITRPGRENETVAYHADIDGLRAVSILLVVGYHAQPWLVPGGLSALISFSLFPAS